jgi:hypothetical protein
VSVNGDDSIESVDVAGVHEVVLEKVREPMEPFSSINVSDPSDPLVRLIPALVTAVSVAVEEAVVKAVRGMMSDLEERLTKKLTAAAPPRPSEASHGACSTPHIRER